MTYFTDIVYELRREHSQFNMIIVHVSLVKLQENTANLDERDQLVVESMSRSSC